MPVVVLPDLEQVVIAYLNASADLQPFWGGGANPPRAYSEIEENPTWPLLVATRIGGYHAVRNRLVAGLVQVEAWGDFDTGGKANQAQAQDLAATAMAVLVDMAGKFVPATGGGSPPADAVAFVTDVEPALDLRKSPDPETNRPRYLFEVRVFARRPI